MYVFGTKPKTRRKVTLVKDDADASGEVEEVEERIGDERENDVLRNVSKQKGNSKTS